MNFDSIFFQTVLQNVADGIVACDENGMLVFFNTALNKIHEQPLKRLQPHEWSKHYNLYYPDGSGLMKMEDVPLYRAWKGEKVDNAEMLIIPESGERKFAYASGSQVKDAKGKVLGAVVTMHDFTEIHKANNNLQEIRHFAQKVSDLTPGLITVFNVNTGKYRYVNNALQTMFGYKPQEALDGGFEYLLSLIHPEDVGKILDQNNKAVVVANETYPDYNDNEAIEFEYRMRHKDGHYVWVHTYAIVFSRNEDNKMEDALNITIDITERKNAELQAVQSKIKEDYFRDLADQSPFMIWKVNEKGLCNYVNKQWSDFTGLSFEESMDLGWGKGFHPEDAGPQYEKFMSCFNQSLPFHSKFRIKTKEGEYRWVLAQSNPLKQKEKGYIGSLTDITEQEAAQEAMELLVQRKDEFISMASHELKTPVTSLKAFTQILQMTFEQQGNHMATDMLIKMDKQINKLTGLIADLLDASKANSGQLKFQNEEFDINELVNEVTDEIQRITTTHTINLKLKKLPIVNGDRNRLAQVIMNLLSNAIKYSPNENKVIVTSEAIENNIKICVEDFGIGIPASQQPKLFTRFFRATNDKTNTYPGLGLGLYISNEIIKRHLGTIKFESEEAKGSIFCITLPLNNTN